MDKRASPVKLQYPVLLRSNGLKRFNVEKEHSIAVLETGRVAKFFNRKLMSWLDFF